MIWLKLYITLLCIHLVLSSEDDYCVSHTPCECVLQSNECIDLTKVGLREDIRFYDVFFENNCSSTVTYSYNPCFAFDLNERQATVKSDYKPCKDAAACVRKPGGTAGERPEEYAIGIQATASFGYSDTYNTTCINYTVEGSNLSLMVILTCNSSTEYEFGMINPACPDNYEIVMNLTSKYACPGKCSSPPPSPSPPSPSGLSVGSKLLIAFFTLLLAYVIVGVLWNFCNGAHGTELIPNIQFWNELPTLIMEGVLFTCSCFSRNNSYGDI